MNMDLVFWGYSVGDLMLAAGRYTLVVSAGLLAIKHALWFLRGRYKAARSNRRTLRAAIELVFGSNLSILYGRHILAAGPDASLGDVATVVVVWSMALLFLGLLLSRQEGVDDQ